MNILAVRPVQEIEGNVETGVEVRGNALAPRARLVSTPSVPDIEKLSWLVLRHGTESAPAASSMHFRCGQCPIRHDPRRMLQAETGASTALNLFYTWSFD